MATKYITVSIEIMHDKNLSPNQKFILAEIHQLSSLEKGCVASNKHFSELIGITTMGVSKAVHDLEKKGYINIDNSQTKRNFGRIITINSGKFTINSGKSGINSGLESKENITKNITKNIEFEKLWADYGKIGSKSLAVKKYSSKSFKRTNKEIELAIKRYLPTVKDKSYQKHFSTFLNNIADWLEDYEETNNLPTSSFPNIDLSQYE